MITESVHLTNDSVQVNVKKLAEIGSYKTPASANSCWYNLKKRLFQNPVTGAMILKEGDIKLLQLVSQCFESKEGGWPKVDNKKLAQLGNYKNPASANSCWYNLKKKLFAMSDDSEQPAPKSGKSSTKKRKLTETSVKAEYGGAPTKKRRDPHSKAGNEAVDVYVKQEISEDAESSDDELEVVKPKTDIARYLNNLKGEDGSEITMKNVHEDGDGTSEERADVPENTVSRSAAGDEEISGSSFLEQVLEFSRRA